MFSGVAGNAQCSRQPDKAVGERCWNGDDRRVFFLPDKADTEERYETRVGRVLSEIRRSVKTVLLFFRLTNRRLRIVSYD